MNRPLALLVVAVTGCGALEPDVGPLLAGTCDNADSDPDASVSFSASIRPLIARPVGGCSCHLPSSTGAGPGIQLSGLDLSSLSSLRRGGNLSSLQIVVPGQPCASVLFQKVSEAPPFGSRMPLGGPPFLSADELALIHDWIAEGASEN